MQPMNAMSIDRYLQRTCAALSAISMSGYMRVIDISSFANIDEIRDRAAHEEIIARSLLGSSTSDDLSTLLKTSYRLKSFAGPINRTLISFEFLRAQVSSSETVKNGIKVSSVCFHNLNYIDPFSNCSFNKQKIKHTL